MDRQLQARIENDPLLQEATEWFVELRSNSVSGERIAEWQDWMAIEAHRKAFESAEALWNLDTRANAVRWPTDAAVAADEYLGDETISTWRKHRESLSLPAHAYRLRQFAPWALAAGVCAMAVFIWTQNKGVPVETAVGEMRTLTLSDGTRVTAGGRTELLARLGTQSREISLKQGEAFFEVTDDKQRPFTVHAGDITVIVIGTAFNIRYDGARTVVAVAEGRVRVDGPTPARLKAGEQLSIDAAGTPASRMHVDVAAVAAWRSGRLQYFNEPLSTVINDLSRYSSRRIRVEDPAVAQLEVTGVVLEQNIDGWLSGLEATFAIQAIRELDGSVRLRAR